jgi:Na+/melibiose symporter-like transporter
MRCYDPPMGGVGPGHARDPESIVVAESRSQMAVLFGFLLVVFAAALIRGVTGATTTTGRVAAAVFCAVLILAIAWGWTAVARRPARLEISRDAVRFMSRQGKASALSRESGDELRFVKQHAGPLSRIWTLGLTVAGTDAVLLLPGFFSRSEVRQACRAQGWRVDD